MTTSTEAMRELRLQRLAAGLCQSCGVRPPRDGRKACEQCLADQAKRARARRERQWPVCPTCKKNPALVKNVTIAGHTRRRLKVFSCQRVGAICCAVVVRTIARGVAWDYCDEETAV